MKAISLLAGSQNFTAPCKERIFPFLQIGAAINSAAQGVVHAAIGGQDLGVRSLSSETKLKGPCTMHKQSTPGSSCSAILLEGLSATLNDRALLVSCLFLVNDYVLTTDY